MNKMQETVREKIRLLRQEKKLTQEYLSDYLGISQAAYSRFENGPTDIDVATIQKLSNFYGIQPADFFTTQNDYGTSTESSPSMAAEPTADYTTNPTKKEPKKLMIELSLTDEEYQDLLPLLKKKIDGMLRA